MTTLEDLASALARIESVLGESRSPYARGDQEAATYAGFRCRKSFRRWAREQGIRPVVRGGLNLWKKTELK